MVTPSTFSTLGTLAGVSQDPTRGWIAMAVANATNQPAIGATASSMPMGTVRYAGTGGVPSSTLTSVTSGGIAFIFNVPAGIVTVSATGGGVPAFMPRTVNARPDKLTFTAVQP